MIRWMMPIATLAILALAAGGVLAGESDEGAAKPSKASKPPGAARNVAAASEGAAKAATPAAKRPAKAPEPTEVRSIVGPDDLPMMMKECRLSDAQSLDLQVKFLNRRKALAEWDRANGGDLEALKQSLASSEDPAQVEPRIAALEADRAKTDAAGEDAILGTLPPEQRLAWESWKLKEWVLQSMMLGGLSDEQNSKIDALSRQAAQDVLGSADRPAARHQWRLKLKETVYNDVLTEVQRLQVGMKAAAPAKTPHAAAPTKIKAPAAEGESGEPSAEKPGKSKPVKDKGAKEKPASAGKAAKKPGKKESPGTPAPLPTPEPVLP